MGTRRLDTPAFRLNTKRHADPDGWRRDIAQAIRSAEGNVTRAAGILGIGVRTLFRIVNDDERFYALAGELRERRAAS